MNPETALMNSTVSGREPLKEALKGAAVLLFMLVLLFFRNWRMFVCPEPWAEDMAVFLRAEYVTGFPDTAFALYAGYIHLLPRIIAWLSLKAGLENAMYVMNCSVLLIKIITCLIILKSGLISSRVIRSATAAYLVLMPFADEIYNNVTNLQWWLIPLMAVIILRKEKSAAPLLLSSAVLLLTGLTGVNSVMFAIPCAYLVMKDRTAGNIIKCSIVILCGAVQLYFLCASGRSGTGALAFEGGISDLVCIFVRRVIFHTLFKSDAPLYVSIPVLALFICLLLLSLRRFGKLISVRFIALFSAIYTAVIFYSLLKSERDPAVLLSTFSGERYFAFLRLCVFALLASMLDLLLRTPRLRGNYKKLLAAACLALAVILARRYPVSFPFSHQYYPDLVKFGAAAPGDTVTIHFPPDWKCDLVKK